MTPPHDPPMTPQVQQAGEAEVSMRYEEKMAQELRALERTHRQSIDDAMAEAQRERSELRETLEAAHALELEGLLAQQAEVRKALELKHSAELSRAEIRAEREVEAARSELSLAREEAAAVAQAAAETGSTQEEALESTEREMRRLYARLKEAQAALEEKSVAASAHLQRLEQLQAIVDAASAERATRAQQSANEALHVRSLTGQVETLGGQLARVEGALARSRQDWAASEQRECDARRERDDTLHEAWRLCAWLEGAAPSWPSPTAGRRSGGGGKGKGGKGGGGKDGGGGARLLVCIGRRRSASRPVARALCRQRHAGLVRRPVRLPVRLSVDLPVVVVGFPS